MQIEPSHLIEIAFTVWNIKASSALVKHQGAASTNIPRARHLAYYLLNKHTDLSVREMAQIFDDFPATAGSGLESARLAIETNFITWKNQAMRNKYLEAVNIINEM